MLGTGTVCTGSIIVVYWSSRPVCSLVVFILRPSKKNAKIYSGNPPNAFRGKRGQIVTSSPHVVCIFVDTYRVHKRNHPRPLDAILGPDYFGKSSIMCFASYAPSGPPSQPRGALLATSVFSCCNMNINMAVVSKTILALY